MQHHCQFVVLQADLHFGARPGFTGNNRPPDPRFELVEIGSVFPPDRKEEPCEDRHLGLAVAAPGRKATHEDALIRKLKTDLETWLHQQVGVRVTFAAADASSPWEHPVKTAMIVAAIRNIFILTSLC